MTVPSRWPPAEPVSELAAHGCDVWLVVLDGECDDSVLSDAERRRAHRFVHETTRHRWAHAHVALRTIVACYAGVNAAAVTFARAPCMKCGELHGKPLLSEPDIPWLRFNLSHSGELGVIAVANGREVGVDIERVRPGDFFGGVADRFTEAEASVLRELRGDERRAAFYRFWVRKEAYLKATGAGLVGSLTSFDASALTPMAGGVGWEFADLDVGPAYAAALALAPPA
jgi:4'-phosphopantetheinyl transferase